MRIKYYFENTNIKDCCNMKITRDENLAANDYAYWRAAIQRAIDTGELRKDVDVEEAVVMFRQVYMGLSFEMAFTDGLDTRLLAKHLHAVYSLLKS